MAKAGRIQHWKHGWIPISQEAKAFAAGLGPKPGSGERGPVPNERFGIPASSIGTKGDLSGGRHRAEAITEMMGGGVIVRPHYQFASQSMSAHHTGGVVIDARSADVIIDHFQRSEEGTSGPFTAARIEGTLPRNEPKGAPELVAQRRARRIKQVLGLKAVPFPEWEPSRPGVPGRYTGGLVFDPATADDLIEQMDRRYTGTPTRVQQLRLAGLGD